MFLAYQPLGSFNLPVALLIATTKSLLVMAVFMELRERRGIDDRIRGRGVLLVGHPDLAFWRRFHQPSARDFRLRHCNSRAAVDDRIRNKLRLVRWPEIGPHGQLYRVLPRVGCAADVRESRTMRLGYFAMPVHPLHRDWVETLREDREAIILADKLGFYDAFIGEHLTDRAENITNSMIFLASLIPETKRIKLATGTANLSHMHPVLIAAQAAMFDHMAEGRFILGLSPGALTSDAEALGILEQDRNRMFAEAIDVILAIWEREPPYDIDFPTTATRSRPRARPRSLSASAIWESPSSSRGLRSSAPSWRRILAGRCADGQTRFSSTVGELPAVAASALALGELQQGQGGRRRRTGRRRLADCARDLCA